MHCLRSVGSRVSRIALSKGAFSPEIRVVTSRAMSKSSITTSFSDTISLVYSPYTGVRERISEQGFVALPPSFFDVPTTLLGDLGKFPFSTSSVPSIRHKVPMAIEFRHTHLVVEQEETPEGVDLHVIEAGPKYQPRKYISPSELSGEFPAIWASLRPMIALVVLGEPEFEGLSALVAISIAMDKTGMNFPVHTDINMYDRAQHQHLDGMMNCAIATFASSKWFHELSIYNPALCGQEGAIPSLTREVNVPKYVKRVYRSGPETIVFFRNHGAWNNCQHRGTFHSSVNRSVRTQNGAIDKPSFRVSVQVGVSAVCEK